MFTVASTILKSDSGPGQLTSVLPANVYVRVLERVSVGRYSEQRFMSATIVTVVFLLN